MPKSSPSSTGGLYDDKTQCPILHVFRRIGGKWKLPILWHLADQETVRYNELKRSVRGVTNMMLTKCLRELEDFGLVIRKQYNEVPPRVEYSSPSAAKNCSRPWENCTPGVGNNWILKKMPASSMPQAAPVSLALLSPLTEPTAAFSAEQFHSFAGFQPRCR